MSEIRDIRKKIRQFIHTNDQILIIPYEGYDLNPRLYWHKIVKKNVFWVVFRTILLLVGTALPASSFKNFLLRWAGMKIGNFAFIAAGVLFDFEYPELINIGDGAIIGTGTKILTHEVTFKHIRIGRVCIGKECLIGASCLIRSGVKIGDYSVVAMDSLVNKDIPPHTLVAGIPEKTIRKIKSLM